MNQQGQTDATQAPAWQCSNAACRASFATPVQHCLTCGALLKGALLSERFRIEALLGRGGMGAVYRATDLALGRVVALKVLAPSAGLAGDAPQELRARFFREARLAAQLDHPNIVPVLHFDIDGPLAYLVMPLLTGGTLAKKLRPRQPTDPALVAGWLRQIAAALDFAHQRPQPIVHRDVKPGNLLFHEDGRLCLADFGIARVAAGAESGEATHLTRTGIVLGSLSYMAPEQINGRAVPASDQYSTGIVLYEALTGVLPFDAADNYGLIIQHSSATPPLPSEHVPGLPRGVDAVVLRALAKQPEARFPTVGALAEAFDRALTSAPTSQVARPAGMRATLPVAPRPTFPLGDAQGLNEPLADDPRGDLPTQAATMLRPPPGQASSFRGVPGMAPPPYHPPPAPRRRSRWLIALLAGLAAIVFCVVALAGLSALRQGAQTRISQTATAGVQSPTSTATLPSDPHLAALLAAESHTPVIQDTLQGNSDHWALTGSARFEPDGLHLTTGRNDGGNSLDAKGGDASALHDRLPLNNCDIEVDVSVSTLNTTYGFAFLPRFPPYHILAWTAAGTYAVAQVVRDAKNFAPSNTEAGSSLALALTPNVSYRLAVLIQGDSLSFFLARQGQPMHYILSITYRPAFQGMGLFGLVNFSNTNASLTTVVYSNLAIYPLS